MTAVSKAPFAPNTTGIPQVLELRLGRGVSRFSNDDPTAFSDPSQLSWIDLGEVNAIDVTASRKYLDVLSSRKGVRTQIARKVTEETFEVAFTTRSCTEHALALAMGATAVDYTNGAILGFVERAIISSVKLGYSYLLTDAATVPNRCCGLAAADLTLKSKGATTTTAAGGRTLTFAASGKTITASTGSFITDGYKVGHKVVVAGTSSNNGTFTITAVTALVITVAETVVNEGPLSSTATLTSADVTLVRDVDYTLDKQGGEVLFLSTAVNVFTGDVIKATLAANATALTMRKIEVASRGSVQVAWRFDGEDAETGERISLYADAMVIEPAGGLAMITDQNLIEIKLKGTAIRLTPTSELARFLPLPPKND